MDFVHNEDDTMGREATGILIKESIRNIEAGLQAGAYIPDDVLGTEDELPMLI